MLELIFGDVATTVALAVVTALFVRADTADLRETQKSNRAALAAAWSCRAPFDIRRADLVPEGHGDAFNAGSDHVFRMARARLRSYTDSKRTGQEKEISQKLIF